MDHLPNSTNTTLDIKSTCL